MSVLSRYILTQVGKPMMATLLVSLLVLLAERMLRVVDLVIGWRGSLLVVFEMLGYLIPHYMGLALPAAFFIGILIVVGRLSREGELDAMSAAGTGLPQLVRPLLGASALLVLLNAFLVGYFQPYSRYAYRAAVQAVTNASFLTLLHEGVFTTVGETTAMVAGMSPDKRQFDGVFLFTRGEGGEEVAITAQRGSLLETSPLSPIRVELARGVQQALPAQSPEAGETPPEVVTLRFGTFETTISDRGDEQTPPRGENERELTIVELLAASWGWGPERSGVDPSEISSELHGRLVRTLSIPLLPFLGVPLSLGRRRTHRSYGLAIGLAALIAYNQLVGVGESLVDNGDAPAWLGLWVPFAAFALLSFWLYWRAAYRVPTLTGTSRLDAAIERLAGYLPKRLAKAVAGP
jgi:lipopolysaccharide export system permease protein